MLKAQEDLNGLLLKHQSEIERLKRMFRNMQTVAELRFLYHYLSNITVEVTQEFISHSEAITTAIVVGYGRLFVGADGTTKLREDIIPEYLRSIHDQIIDLRHSRYAHHGAHDSVACDLHTHFDGESVIVSPRIELILCLGAPKEWAPLFQWIDGFIYDTSQAHLAHLTKISGVTWKMPNGETPSWIAEA